MSETVGLASVALSAASTAVVALVAYLAVRIRAEIAQLEVRMLHELASYVRKEECRALRASYARLDEEAAAP